LSPNGDFVFALDEAGSIAQLSMKGAVLSTFDSRIGCLRSCGSRRRL